MTALALTSCFKPAGDGAMATGGEVTGVRSGAFSEPAPFGMVAVERGALKVGLQENDTLWGAGMPSREISVDGFWMDEKEVTNAM